MSGKHHKLGGTWTCECGKQHKLNGGYLAAHWRDELIHKCECGREHMVQSGLVRLVKTKKARTR